MAEQRCGTCKWWERWKLRSASANPSEYGDCNWPLPVLANSFSRLATENGRESMAHEEGTDCPCWQRREGA